MMAHAHSLNAGLSGGGKTSLIESLVASNRSRPVGADKVVDGRR